MSTDFEPYDEPVLLELLELELLELEEPVLELDEPIAPIPGSPELTLEPELEVDELVEPLEP